jgi:hypothetical protein
LTQNFPASLLSLRSLSFFPLHANVFKTNFFRETAGAAGKRRKNDESVVVYRGAARPTRRTPKRG